MTIRRADWWKSLKRMRRKGYQTENGIITEEDLLVYLDLTKVVRQF